MPSIEAKAKAFARRLPPRQRAAARRLFLFGQRALSRAADMPGSRLAIRSLQRVTSGAHAHPGSQLTDAGSPIVLESRTHWFEFPVEPYQRYEIEVELSVDFAEGERAVLLQYRFVDRLGRAIESTAVNKPRSPAYGYFDYLPRTPENRVSSQVIFTPEGTQAVQVGLRRYKPQATGPIAVNAAAFHHLGPRIAVREYDLDTSMPPRTSMRIAVIADTFTLDALRMQCQVLAMSKAGWREQLAEFDPDFVLIESAWAGNDGDWIYEIVHLSEKRFALRELLEHVRERGIPSLFWNKEDPPHFEDFLEAARLCDYVATTDAQMIPGYRDRLGHDRIFSLPFAIQSDLHNPRRPHDDKRPRHPEAAFLGSWWAEKFDERRTAQDALLEGSAEVGLAIFDRYFQFNDHERYRFPRRWLRYVHGSLEYSRVLSAYRQFNVVLNVNTVTNSETMFSRRALEAAACGAVVISNPSLGTRAALGDLVLEAATAEECHAHLEALAADPTARDRRAHDAYRHVHREHTWDNRLADVAQTLGLFVPGLNRVHKISVVLATKRPAGARRILEWLEEVQQQGSIEIEPIVVTAFEPSELGDDGLLERIGAIVQKERDGHTLGDSLNVGVDFASGDLVAKVDDDDLYGHRYFDDLLLAMEMSRADVCGKQAHLQYFESADVTVLRYPGSDHRYTDFVCGSTLLIKRTVFDQVRFPSRRVGEDTNFLNRAAGAGYRIYSADRFAYISMRRTDLNSHTWQVEADDILGGSQTERVCAGIATAQLEA